VLVFFELIGDQELAAAEKRYLPIQHGSPRAIVLTASRGTELGSLTEDRPKCMVDVRGQPLLQRLVNTLSGAQVRDIMVMRDYQKEMANLPTIKTVDNDFFGSTGEAATLACAKDVLRGDRLIAYGDILFRQYIMEQLLSAEGDIALMVDALWRERNPDPRSRLRDLVACTTPFQIGYLGDGPVKALQVGPKIREDAISGEWIGLAKANGSGAKIIRSELTSLEQDGELGEASLYDLFNRLITLEQDVRMLYIIGHWLDVDNKSDLEAARSFL
jgi:phosphoenolpyruvate phosphomutase